MNAYDIVVVGAGHNALVTAAYAARAGFRVAVLEAAPEIGGDTSSAQLTLPGYWHDPCATAHNLIQSNPLLRDNELGLDRYGLRYLQPDPVFTMPFRDGASITMWRDLERTCAEIGRLSGHDAVAYRELLADWQQMGPILNAEREEAPRPPQDADARWASGPLGERALGIRRSSALDQILTRFEEPHVRCFFAWIAFMTLSPIDEAETGILAYSLVAGRQKFSWTLPEGGSVRLPMALKALIDDHGGTVLTGKRVSRITLSSGRADEAQTEDGERFGATKAIVSSMHITELPRAVGAEHFPAGFLQAVDQWHASLPMFVTHYALSEAPRWKTHDGDIASVTMGGLQSLDCLSAMLRGYRTGTLELHDPVYLVITPTLADASRAPAGKHTFKVVSFLPYAIDGDATRWDGLKQTVSERLFDQLCALSTNLSRRIVLAEHVDSPLDLERRNAANWRGSCHGGAASPSQSGWFRPAEGWSGYRMPIEGLYQTGSCTHPGGSVSGLPGRNCARVLLADLGVRFDDVIGRKAAIA